MITRRLMVPDAAALVVLRRHALESDPLAFAASIEDDRGLSLDFLRTVLADASEQAIFGHFQGTELLGMVGLMRESKAKRRHLATIWGMFVAARARSRGAGRALLEAAVAHAHQWAGVTHVQLGVSDTALHARRLYESAGFRPWGREPRALCWNGRFVDEYHLVLDLEPAPATAGPRILPPPEGGR
jgi:GNAT superfamily N-acetyltransferase